MKKNTAPVNAAALPASRRSVLRGLATLPLISVPAMATAASAEPDPIFAAIEKHRVALAATEAAPTDAEVAEAAAFDSDLMHDLAETVPQTVAGLRAMVLHFAEIQRSTGEDYDVGVAFPAIAQAMAALLPAA